MPGYIKSTGFNELKRKFAEILKESDEALAEAEKESAKVMRSAIKAAAPRNSGGLAGSIQIQRVRDKGLLKETKRSLFKVGPSRKKGPHGALLEEGWTAAGSRRVARSGRGKAHSQRGVTATRKIPGNKWFTNAVRGAEQRALKAGKAVLIKRMKRVTD